MKKKVLTAVAICALCAVCIAIGAATTAVTSISAELRPDFTIIIDGQQRTFRNVNGDVVDPILYQGTTYLPIRAIGEIMGKTVTWYENENKIELSDKKPTVTDADVIVDNGSQTGAQNDAKITQQRAKEIALERAGLTADQVVFDRTELDIERGILIYEIEFRNGTTEYSADISAEDGSILSWEIDREQAPTGDAKGDITEQQAREIALERAGLTADQVIFDRTELDIERGTLIYEVEFHNGATEYSADISAADGSILSWEVDNHQPTAPAQPQQSTTPSDNRITQQRAKEIALEKVALTENEVIFEKTELDRENGITVYEVEFKKGRVEYSFEINAETGEIITWEVDRD